MVEMDVVIEVKDFMDCLKEENNKLREQLAFAQKCIDLFKDYRNCLIGFANSCNCEHNFNLQMVFDRLEYNYKTIVDEDMRNSAIFSEKTINVEFNKQQTISESNDNNEESVDENCAKETAIESNKGTHTDIFGNILTKLKDNLKNDSEDYRLMFLKNKSGDSCEHFKCNWFKCQQIFASEANLSQHMRCEHFRVLEYSDDFLFDEPQEMVIKCEPDIKPKLLTPIRAKSKRVLEEYVCQWIGCEMEFRTESELKRHETLVHNKATQSSAAKMPRFSGLKPLTIHTLDLDKTTLETIQAEKPFKCDLCDKSYTRKDSLKYHMTCEHKLGDTTIKMYFCDHCDYQTKNNSHMKRHILRRHTNERPYKCDLGDCHPDIKCFATLDQLRSHQTNIHPKEIF